DATVGLALLAVLEVIGTSGTRQDRQKRQGNERRERASHCCLQWALLTCQRRRSVRSKLFRPMARVKAPRRGEMLARETMPRQLLAQSRREGEADKASSVGSELLIQTQRFGTDTRPISSGCVQPQRGANLATARGRIWPIYRWYKSTGSKEPSDA